MGGGASRDVRTVTFLFSDVEGSTRLLQDVGEAYGDTIDAYRAVVRDAIAASNGQELGTEGDSFFVVFENASDAVRCAAHAQLGLKSARWPARVRVGIHSGEATQRAPDRYVGLAVHQAARVAAAANGGQTLLTESTRLLVAAALPDGCELDDLGLHRFKDLDRPLRLFELLHPEFEASRPPRTLDAELHNLPVQATPFTGRYEELDQIRKFLQDGGVRLLTLIGPGGIGKTRLSLQAAAASIDSFPDGVWFVPLATVPSADRVASAIAQVIGVSETHDTSPTAAVIEDLTDKKALLVLDNVEHVLECRELVSQILREAPSMAVIATSREPLRVAAEQLYPVPTMHLPPEHTELESLAHTDAVRLFVERIRAHDPNFVLDDSNASAVADICRRLDGLPLAIELGAARAASMGPIALAERLRSDLDALGGGPDDAPERHRTLEAAVSWSYDALDPRLQRIFRALSVFADAFSEAAAREIADATLDDLLALADRSLLRRDPESAEPRFAMLTTIRKVAYDELVDAGELDACLDRHTAYFRGLTIGLQNKLQGPEAVATLDVLDEAQHDIRAVIDRLADPRDTADVVAEMAEYWRIRGYLEETRDRLRTAIDACPPGTPERARAVVALSRLRRGHFLTLSSKLLLPELLDAIETAHAAGDRRTEARALTEVAPHVGSSDLDPLFPGTDARTRMVSVFQGVGVASKEERASGREVLVHALAIAEDVGDGALADSIRTSPYYQRGFRAFMAASFGTQATIAPAIRSATTRGDRATEADFLLRRSTGPVRERRADAERALAFARELGDKTLILRALARLSDFARRRKDYTAAVELAHEALQVQDAPDVDEEPSDFWFGLASTASELGDIAALRRIHSFASERKRGRSLYTLMLMPWAVSSRFRGFGALTAGIVWSLAFAMHASLWRAVVLGACAYVFTQALDSAAERPSLWRRVAMHDGGAIFFPGIAFLIGLAFRQPTLAGVLAFVLFGSFSSGGLLRGNVFGRTAKPIAAVIVAAGIVAVLVHPSVAPLVALALAVHVGARSADEPSSADAAWAVLRAASAVARIGAGFVGADLLARWYTGGAFGFAAWHRAGLPAAVGGLIVSGLLMAVTDTELRFAGVALALGGAGLAVAFGGYGHTAALIGGLVFGLSWVVCGLQRVRAAKPEVPEIFPERFAVNRPVRQAP